MEFLRIMDLRMKVLRMMDLIAASRGGEKSMVSSDFQILPPDFTQIFTDFGQI
jgi:hypothetical protein